MKMENIQSAQTILSGDAVIELADADLAMVLGGHAEGNASWDCQDNWAGGDDWGDWGDGDSYYKNSFNNNDSDNTNLNLLNGFSIL